MVTKLIGVKQFRQNISSYYRQSVKNNWRFIILNRNQPIFEVRPISDKKITLEKLAADVAKARQNYKQGRVYSLDSICREFGV